MLQTLSTARLQALLHAMNLTSAGCVEKSELRSRVREGFTTHFGTPHVVEPTDSHRATFIFAHGLGDTGAGWTPFMRQLSLSLPHVRFVCPTAPSRAVTLNGGAIMPAWYDIHGLDVSAREDVESLTLSSLYLTDLVEREAAVRAKSGEGPPKIVLGGFSQGAALSLFTLLTSSPPLAGVVALSGYLAGRAAVAPFAKEMGRVLPMPSSVCDTPVWIAHGTCDGVIPLAWSTASVTELRQTYGLKAVKFQSYQGLDHSTCPAEEEDLLAFLKLILQETY